MGDPLAGVYDIVFTVQYSNVHRYTLYMQFDSNLNTGSLKQTIIGPIVSGYWGYNTNNLMTLNGKYLIILDNGVGVSAMVLYNKVEGSFIQIYNTTNLFNGATPFYIAEDASMIILSYPLFYQKVC
jgi:hypothetical protein